MGAFPVPSWIPPKSNMKLKLAHKLALIIVVPLLLQMAFLTQFSAVVNEFAAEQKREKELTAVSIEHSRLNLAENQAFLFYGIYRANRQAVYKQKFLDNERDIEAIFARLATLWSDKPERWAILNSAHHANQRIFAYFQFTREYEAVNIEESLGGYFGKYYLRIRLNPLAGVSPTFGKLGTNLQARRNLEKLFEDDERAEAIYKQSVQRKLQQIQWLLFLGFLGAMLSSIILGFYFSKNVSSRLEQVVGMMFSLLQGNRVSIAIAGADEIAALGRAVAQMIEKIGLAEEFQSQAIAVVVNELETPITTARNALLTLYKSGQLKVDYRITERFDNADKELTRLQNLVREMAELDASKSAEYKLVLADIQLQEIAETSVQIVSEFAKSRTVELKVACEYSPIVIADREKLLQVVVNLLSNAIKFSPPGSEVVVNVSRVDDFGRLSVSDRGAGIDDEFKQRIFRKFEQAESNKTHRQVGTGFGLAFSKEVVERQNGKVDFESTVGVGSRFWVDLPLTSASVESKNFASANLLSKIRVPWRKSLLAKCLLLTLLPNTVNLVGLAVLSTMVISVGTNIKDYENAQRIVSLHRQVIESVGRGTLLACIYNLDRDDWSLAMTKQEMARIVDSRNELNLLFSSVPSLRSERQALNEIVDYHLRMEQEVLDAPRNADLARWYGSSAAPKTQSTLVQIQDPMEKTISALMDSIESRKLASAETQSALHTVLVVSTLCSALLSLILAVLVADKLRRRINMLLDKTRLYSEHKIVDESDLGDDEIGYVNKSFCLAALKLEEMEQFRKELVAVTSHELRTPLTALLALVELLEQGVFGELNEHAMSLTIVAKNHMTDLVEMITNLLDVERMQAGKVMVVPQDTDVDTIFEEVEVACERFRDDDNKISLKVERSGLTLVADSRRIAQSLSAALQVILDVAPNDSQTRLYSEQVGSQVCLTISSRLPKAALKYLQNKGGKESLAFDLCELVAKQHGGIVSLSSFSGGSLFEISIPREQPQAS